jgi:hypothetical protein
MHRPPIIACTKCLRVVLVVGNIEFQPQQPQRERTCTASRNILIMSQRAPRPLFSQLISKPPSLVSPYPAGKPGGVAAPLSWTDAVDSRALYPEVCHVDPTVYGLHSRANLIKFRSTCDSPDPGIICKMTQHDSEARNRYGDNQSGMAGNSQAFACMRLPFHQQGWFR